jgi:L-alanine-DL-glutamate epimerase-like enolase superfamily enzyme
MSKTTDIRPIATTLYFLPIETRVPLKFGGETLTHVTCARVRMTVRSGDGEAVYGWGETPLSVQWVWPSPSPYEERHQALKDFCVVLAQAWAEFEEEGHALEVGHVFQETVLHDLLATFNAEERKGLDPMPHLAALVCCSLFDIALHDAYGRLVEKPIYETYNAEFMNRDLSTFIEPAAEEVSFEGVYPADLFVADPPTKMRAWHLVGGLDPLEESELTGDEPDDGYPVMLRDWIRRDGLKCLKIKLRGNDQEWDYERVVKVGQISMQEGVDSLTTDFNCTVTDPEYVNVILDRLEKEQPIIHSMILYVEQPFPYDLEANPIDTHSLSARKPLFLDESAHDWKFVRLGRELGWTGVALKTCKTQTGAVLSACFATTHGMALMVQDLTNPMLSQVPHCLLAANVGTIMGVETNGMQFYPEASAAEAKVHPGIYERREGEVDLGTLEGPGFGYRVEEIQRELPDPVASFG